jgi:hypothetical protein
MAQKAAEAGRLNEKGASVSQRPEWRSVMKLSITSVILCVLMPTRTIFGWWKKTNTFV